MLARNAGQAFTDGMKSHFPVDYEVLLANAVQQPCERLVRFARARLDITMMLCRRQHNAVLVGQAFVVRAIRFDASPQKGIELFASREDVWSGLDFVSVDRHLPFSVLGCGFLSAFDKAMTFLWQVFLEVGADVYAIRAYLRQVLPESHACSAHLPKVNIWLLLKLNVFPSFPTRSGFDHHREATSELNTKRT